MEYRRECGRCLAALDGGSSAYICANECTFCPTCYRLLGFACPNCTGELVRRPRAGAFRRAALPPPPPADPAVRVRRAGPGDLEAVAPLFDAYRQFYEQPSNRPASRRFLAERMSRDESVVFVAEREGVAVGFAQLYPLFTSITLGRAYLLNDLFVRPDYRRHGVGARLLEAARAYGREAGAHYLELSTAADNPAQRLYEACGWILDRGFLFYELPLEATPQRDGQSDPPI